MSRKGGSAPIYYANNIFKFISHDKATEEKNGFNGFDKIFVSNEYKCNKGNGKLFNIVKKMYKNKKFIHIGDNYFADVLGAKNRPTELLSLQ